MTDRQRDAALARGAHMRELADRPSMRRSGEQPTSLPLVRMRSDIEIRESSGSSTAHFHGVASATDTPYEMYDAYGPYSETVVGGAFGKTLAQEDLDVPLVLAHDSLRRLARTTNGTLSLAETSNGLEVDAPELDREDADVAYILPKLRSGLVDEMSFRFSITRGQWSPDWMEYHIEQVDLHRGDVAIVGYGANPYTSAALRTADSTLASQLGTTLVAGRTDEYLIALYREARAALRLRGIKPPMSLEDLRA